MTKKNPSFPNDTFKDQEEYFDFVAVYRIFGNDAYALKKKMDKQKDIGEPRIRESKTQLTKNLADEMGSETLEEGK